MSKVLTMAIMLAVGSWVTGCNTTRGVGQDVEKVGEVVQDTANETSDAIKKKN